MHIRPMFCLFLAMLTFAPSAPSRAADETKGPDKAQNPAVSERQKDFTVYDEAISNDPKMRSEFIVRMFTSGCFNHFFDQNTLVSWANSYLTEIPGSEGARFWPLVGAKGGRVWTANITGGKQPLRNNQVVGGGEIVMILEDTGECHVLGYGTDEDALHAGLKDLAAKLTANMKDKAIKYTFTPKGEKADYSRSDITILQPENKALVYAFASTVPGGLHDHTVSISLKANFKIKDE